MTWRAISARSIAGQVIQHKLNTQFVSQMPSSEFDVAHNICQAQRHGDVERRRAQVQEDVTRRVGAVQPVASQQCLTLVHMSAQREHLLCDGGCSGGFKCGFTQCLGRIQNMLRGELRDVQGSTLGLDERHQRNCEFRVYLSDRHGSG